MEKKAFIKHLLFGLVVPLLINGCSQEGTIKSLEVVTYSGKDTLQITADFYRTGVKNDPVVLMFHQSASSRGEYATIAPDLQKRGFNCLAVDLRWGKQDFWNQVPNETARSYGTWEVIDNFQPTDEYQYEEVWPRMFASYDDILASIDYVKREGYSGPIIVWGSSFSAMLVFKAAVERPDDVTAVVAYSPGEYYGRDTLMLTNWIQQMKQPAFINSGKDSSEYQMTGPLFKALPSNQEHVFNRSIEGRHGSSVLLADDRNWTPILQFLNKFKQGDQRNYLSYAREAGKWLESTSTKNSDGIWPDKTSAPENISLSLSQGVSSKILFYLELFKTTQDSSYLEEAIKGADYITTHLPSKDSLSNEVWPFGSYGPVCGSGAALIETFKTTNQVKYDRAARQLITLIESSAQNKEDTISWDAGNDVLGGLAGTGLFLLYAAQELDSDEALRMAEKAGNTLLARAIEEDTGLNWYFGQDRPFILPNFSHGAAGIGFFFARLFEVTGNELYLESVLEVNNYLESITSDTISDGFLLPYGVPNVGWSSSFDIGWGHGPAGVARLYQQLNKVNPKSIWKDRMKACMKAIKWSGIPDDPNPIFGNTTSSINYRFGMAGVAHFAIDMYLITGDESYLSYAKELVDHIITYARIGKQGMYWPMTVRDGSVDYYTGHFYGAAGYGRLLIKLSNAINEKSLNYAFPDEVR